MSGPQEPQQQAQAQTPEQIEAEIEQTRQDLADTVDALGAKMDVKARLRPHLPVIAGVTGAVLVGALTLVVVRRRRR